MLNSRTVLIVGAGASAEVGFPTGDALKARIADSLAMKFSRGDLVSGDGNIYQTLGQKYHRNMDSWLKSCRQVGAGVPLSASVDDFVDIHKDDQQIVTCSKVAIARAILFAEQRSKLYFKPEEAKTIDYKSLASTWYPLFYQLVSGVGKSSVHEVFRDLSIVCFNYDRCIEHFFVHALRDNYLLKNEQAGSIVGSISIYRPYGSVGAYFDGTGTKVEFGAEILPNVDTITSTIKTYTEQVEDEQSLETMRQAIADAETLVFLGNAYHPRNMQLLEPKPTPTVSKKIFATRHGIVSDEDLSIVREKLSRFHAPSSSTADRKTFFADTCANLFSSYRLSLRE